MQHLKPTIEEAKEEIEKELCEKIKGRFGDYLFVILLKIALHTSLDKSLI